MNKNFTKLNLKTKFTLKKIIYLIFLLSSFPSFAQFVSEGDPHRGMYIDKFVKTYLYNSYLVDPEFSILGVDNNFDGIFEKEDHLLRYAAESHITYLALFDLHRIFGKNLMVWDENLSRMVDLEVHLLRFMKKAKSQYGITQIGAIGGSENFFDSLSTFLNRYPQADFDVVNTEYEFWVDCPNEFPNFIPILNAMHSMKDAYNLAHPNNPMISEAYLAALQYCNSSYGTASVVKTIDGCVNCSPCLGCSNPHPRLADRILHAWYVSDPGSVNIAEQNFFELPDTEDSTDFHPILYSEGYSTGGTVDWTGAWFPLSSSNNIFTAEEAYYTSWRNNSSVAFSTPRQNNVQAGGVQWFAATNMVGHLDHPQILQNRGPYCLINTTAKVTFDYFGPIESDIAFQFWVTNNIDSSTIYPAAGGRINGVSGVYQPITSTTTLIENINFSDSLTFPPCNLPAGEYTAHLKLTYNGGYGESYECENSIIVDPQLHIEIVGQTDFCEGDFTYLKTNANGGAISWYKDGNMISGNNEYLLVTSDGFYSCTITGGSGCSGMSDTVHIHVLPNPAIGVNAVCNANGSATLKTNLLQANPVSNTITGPGGVMYRWNTGHTTDQITVTPPSTNTTYRVNVTDPYSGCSRTAQITLKSPLQNPYSTSITINNQPSSPCSSDGSLTAILNAGGAPNNYLWSNGETTQTITNLSPGTYSVAMNVWASGCTSYGSITLGILPSNAPVVQPIIQDVPCAGESNGSIVLNITGGNPPFSFQWESIPDDSIHQPTNKDQANLFAGIYSVTITDASGCNYFHTFIVATLSQSLFVQSTGTHSVTGCWNGTDGWASAIPAGGIPPYTYLWNDSLQQTTYTASTLKAGSYMVTVTDSAGCRANGYVHVNSLILPMQVELLDSSRTVVSCSGVSDGNLFVNIVGGTEPYTIISPWISDSNFAELISLPSGVYPIQITDSSGCMLTDSFQITNPPDLQLYSTANATSCIGCQNGSFDISMMGGVPPYTISWLPATGNLSGNQIRNLQGGIYSICISDLNGCNQCIQDTIIETPSGFSDLDIHSLLNVYPNPYSAFTVLSLKNEIIKSGVIIINSVDGKTVLSKKISDSPLILLKEDLKAGIYFIRLYKRGVGFIGGVKKLVVAN